jgi:excisionase family DNA binding protein
MTVDLLPVEAVAPLLGKGVDWVKRQARAGVIPCRRIGRSYRFTSQDIEDYIESAKQSGRAVTLPTNGTTPRSGRGKKS